MAKPYSGGSEQRFTIDFIYCNLTLIKQGFYIHFEENFFTLHGRETANGNIFDTDMEPKNRNLFYFNKDKIRYAFIYISIHLLVEMYIKNRQRTCKYKYV